MPIKLLIMEITMILGGSVVFVLSCIAEMKLLADGAVADLSASNPTTAIGALVAGFSLMTALLAWVVKHLLDTTVPSLQNSFQTSMDRQRDTFQLSLEKMQASNQDAIRVFQTMLESHSKIFSANEAALRDLFEKKIDQSRDFFDKELATVLAEARIDRERFFDAIVNHKDDPIKKLTT